jgi:hypothetical protein
MLKLDLTISYRINAFSSSCRSYCRVPLIEMLWDWVYLPSCDIHLGRRLPITNGKAGCQRHPTLLSHSFSRSPFLSFNRFPSVDLLSQPPSISLSSYTQQHCAVFHAYDTPTVGLRTKLASMASIWHRELVRIFHAPVRYPCSNSVLTRRWAMPVSPSR